MKLPQATLTRLANGLRLVHIHQHNVGAGIFGIVVRVGSADESASQHGLAHLVEHTIFKGTQKRSSWHIINRMEAVGGELNAFTTKEETTVYSIFPSGGASRAIELIADLALNSRFPERELEKEREVVLDEIYSYRDTPSEAVFDDFEDLVFESSPLGHNILGTPESVKELGSEDCRQFLRKYYRAGNMVAFYSGPQGPERIATLVEKYFDGIEGGDAQRVSEAGLFVKKTSNVEIDGLHQVHAVLGIQAASLYSTDRFADSLFTNMIGGPGMNSLLNVELRERRGLVYNVEAGVTHFSAEGLLTVYYGCDADDNERCLRICKDAMSRLAETADDALARKLVKAKRQYIGQLAIASENRENRIMAAARTVLFKDVLPVDDAVVEAIESVAPQQIKSLAAQLAEPAILTYCPV